jgi:hypothetical protein
MKAKEAAEKIAALEKRVAELEKRPSETHNHYHSTYYQDHSPHPYFRPWWEVQYYPNHTLTCGGGTEPTTGDRMGTAGFAQSTA